MTVDELVGLLQRYPGGTTVEFSSHDGPDYGWLDLTTEGPAGQYRVAVIGNNGIEPA